MRGPPGLLGPKGEPGEQGYRGEKGTMGDTAHQVDFYEPFFCTIQEKKVDDDERSFTSSAL